VADRWVRLSSVIYGALGWGFPFGALALLFGPLMEASPEGFIGAKRWGILLLAGAPVAICFALWADMGSWWAGLIVGEIAGLGDALIIGAIVEWIKKK